GALRESVNVLLEDKPGDGSITRQIHQLIHFGDLKTGLEYVDLRLIGIFFILVDGNDDHRRAGNLKHHTFVVPRIAFDQRSAKLFFVIIPNLTDAVAGGHFHDFITESSYRLVNRRVGIFVSLKPTGQFRGGWRRWRRRRRRRRGSGFRWRLRDWR